MRARCGGLGLVALLLASSCSDVNTPNGPDEAANEALRAGLLISGLTQLPPPSDPVGPAVRIASLTGSVAYISLVPGSVDDGTSTDVTNRRTGERTTVPMVDGGFDPVPLTAVTGDTLEIVVARTGGVAASAVVIVEADATPDIVRTNPPRGSADVPVNTNITIVFSEPLTVATVTTASVRVLLNAEPVDGLVGVQGANAYTVEFVPLAPLQPGATYTVSLQPTITSLSGNAMTAEVSSTFTTSLDAVQPMVFASIDARQHTCALTPQGQAYCWGRNPHGGVGDGTTIHRSVPTPVAGGLTFASLSVGLFRTCGLTAAGEAYCWGKNDFGQFGNGTFTNQLVPTRAALGLVLASISTAAGSTCGVTTDGDAYCWGEHRNGQVGAAADTCAPQGCASPIKVAGDLDFASVGVGEYSTCGRTTSSVAYCWGYNALGELGLGTSTGPEICTHFPAYLNPAGGPSCSRVPVQVTGALQFADVSAGSFFNCGRTQSGEAWCWGANNQGQFGIGTASGFTPNAPTATASDLRFSVLIASNQRACGIATTGESYCWGLGFYYGAPGCVQGVGCSYRTPVLVPGGYQFTTIVSNSSHACALTGEGHAYCWGSNSYGALGNGSTISTWIPVAVKRP